MRLLLVAAIALWARARHRAIYDRYQGMPMAASSGKSGPRHS